MEFSRAAGLSGLAFGVSVLVVNVFLVVPAKPLGGAGIPEIVAYYANHGSAVRVFGYVGPLAWVMIALFAVGVVDSTRTANKVSAWALLGMAGVVTMIATFCGVVTADLVLAIRAPTLEASPMYAQLLWDFHMVLQILNLTFVAIALGGFGMAAVTSGTAPRLGKLAVVGALLLLAAATQSESGVTESGPTLVALPGFAIWLIFVVGYSVTMIRSPGASPTSSDAAPVAG